MNLQVAASAELSSMSSFENDTLANVTDESTKITT